MCCRACTRYWLNPINPKNLWEQARSHMDGARLEIWE
ncbi:hypothetical protein [Pseudomonas fluorescens]